MRWDINEQKIELFTEEKPPVRGWHDRVMSAFYISQESASCEIKSLRHDAQLAEKNPARVRRKPEQV